MNRSILVGLVVGVSALAFSSCAYDPYYAGSYGDGYGYGASGFSTSYFVSTGNSRWAYDPYAGAYYDNTRRCYYDPYLNGYYPIGYRPHYVYGAPHPHGWSRGSSYCPPPNSVRSYNLTNYRDRTDRYRSLGKDWSRNVRATDPGRDHRSGSSNRDQRSSNGSRSSSQGGFFGGSNGGTRDYTPPSSGSSSFNRGDRSSSREGSSNRGNLSVVVPPQSSLSPQSSFSRNNDRRGGDANRTFGGKEQQRQERSVPQRVEQPTPQRVEQPTPQRVESPTPQRTEAPRYERGGDRSERHSQPDNDGRERSRGVRGLGEG
jgi:hypothetical protein